MPAPILHRAVAALVALPCILGAQQPSARAPLDTAALERVLLDEMRETRTPGVSIAVVRGSEVVYAKGFGVASVETREPVTPATLFRIGSTTKMFTGLTAVLLAQDGKLRFDVPISRYAKGLTPAIGRLTLDALLTHRAGMINEASGAGPHDDAALGVRVRSWGGEHLAGPSGDIYSYSGPGYWLAGYVIEQAARQWYADAVHDRVLAPLGMTRSTLRPLAAMTWPLAQDHRVRDTTVAVLRPFTDDVTTWPSGSLFSSATELARFTIAIVNQGRVDGKQLFPAAAIAELTRPRAAVPGGDGCRYAYGLSACTEHGVRTLSHYGFRVGSGSVITMAPDSQVAVIILANRNGGIFGRTAAKAMELMVGIPASGGDAPAAKPDSVPPAGTELAARENRFLGTYVSGPDTLRVVRTARGLVYRYGGEDSAVRTDGPDAILVLDAANEPVQRFMLVRGARSGTWYLHDGLNAFPRVAAAARSGR